ncbi:hypothetical protein EYF80_013879 [Liparis tanakae]|uniref:Secreted protein n=1 Tax=Liparis tanakae TaxID=230148 RepID=A0A4Z2ICV6_9TELE|nr:hypothetical protein EYF80_013879 [Liparis tanakae]
MPPLLLLLLLCAAPSGRTATAGRRSGDTSRRLELGERTPATQCNEVEKVFFERQETLRSVPNGVARSSRGAAVPFRPLHARLELAVRPVAPPVRGYVSRGPSAPR